MESKLTGIENKSYACFLLEKSIQNKKKAYKNFESSAVGNIKRMYRRDYIYKNFVV